MRASKGNKEYFIDESQQKSYQDRGFDIKDDNGSVIAYGRGKTVPYGEYMALKEELEELKAEAGESTEFSADIPEGMSEEKEPDTETKRGKAASQRAGE